MARKAIRQLSVGVLRMAEARTRERQLRQRRMGDTLFVFYQRRLRRILRKGDESYGSHGEPN